MLADTLKPPLIIGNEKVTARKDHVCDWCKGKIPKGEEYRRVRLKSRPGDDSSFKCEKVHLWHFK